MASRRQIQPRRHTYDCKDEKRSQIRQLSARFIRRVPARGITTAVRARKNPLQFPLSQRREELLVLWQKKRLRWLAW